MEASSVLSPTDRGCALICKRFLGGGGCGGGVTSLYFHLFSSLLERWHDNSSHRSGRSVAVPHLPPLLIFRDVMGLTAASAGQSGRLCFGD